MTKAFEASIPLSDKCVWIIDDDIPLGEAGLDDDDLLLGKRPIDRGTLRVLLDFDGWSDGYVRELCEQLVYNAQEVLAFTQPEAAIGYLRDGIAIPDVIVYDLRYERYSHLTQEKVLEYLEYILERCVSIVQVYTKQSLAETNRDLQELYNKFSTRLVPSQNKEETNAERLSSVIAERLQDSLSAWMAKEIRKSSLDAIEKVLVKIDDLPLDVAFKMLAGEKDFLQEQELVELLSTKISEALESSIEVNKVFEQYVTKKGIPHDQVPGVVQEVVSLLVSRVREHIQSDGSLFNTIGSVSQAVQHGSSNIDNEQVKQTVQDFFAFRIYAQPNDDLVRTGDIIFFQEDQTVSNSPDLYLILTPACDLVKFWKSTRGSITIVKMYPLITGKGIERASSYGNSEFKPSGSITANHPPMILPSIPLEKNEWKDYALFAYEIRTIDLKDAELMKAGKRNKSVRKPLTYSKLDGKIKRICRISEPFLTGILTELQHALFRFGIPDYPTEELDRLKRLFKG